MLLSVVILLSDEGGKTLSEIVINGGEGRGGKLPVVRDAGYGATGNLLHSCQPGICCSPRPKQISAKT